MAQALAEYRCNSSTKGDQEAYVATIHGTQLRLVAAYFTREYLECVQSREMPTNQELYVRWSRWLELKEPRGRVDALFCYIRLINYLLSGDAVIEHIKAVSKDLRKEANCRSD